MSEEPTRTALVRARKDEAWTRIKSLVLDSVTSPPSKRAYEQGLDAFERWCAETGATEFTKATVQAYRSALEAGGLAASSINVRLSAIRKLAAEATDNGLLAPEVAAAIGRVRGAKRHGTRAGNWLTLDQAERLLELPDSKTAKGKRDRALLALLVGCGLRRQELAGLRIEDIQQRDGRWCIVDLAGKGNRTVTQIYLPNTNVLVTRLFTDEGAAEITDFMSVGQEAGGATRQTSRQVVRIARAIRGPVNFRLECRPAFDYARQRHDVELSPDRQGALFTSAVSQFALKGTRDLRLEGDAAVSEFTLASGDEAHFVLRHRDRSAGKALMEEPLDAQSLLTETVRFWRGWASVSRYHGRWREMVTRSALVLKMLTFLPTGAIVAAPTTSLPEHVGGARNWDYRYTWVRDAAFTVYALMRLGYTEEAAAFALFIQARAKEEETSKGPLNVLYGIDGRHDSEESILDHLSGYRNSKPVRIGNAAVGHLQLDIYGELMDSIYLYDKYGSPLSYDMWTTVERLLDWLVKNWDQPDQSIWEVRGERRQFTYSKLQCWVAFDRGIRLARKRSFPTEGDTWLLERNRIYNGLMRQGWNDQVGAFTQYFGASAMDASVLMMPLMLFVSPKDPRMLSTIARLRDDLVSDSLVSRYRIGEAAHDGLPGTEGSFTICSFWLVEAMARAGMVEEAQLLFEKLLSYANHLGLFSEEIGARGELLGNFPQALTHLGLISAAYNLDRILG